jgi:predicted RNA-binding Zn ribbon-like protein
MTAGTREMISSTGERWWFDPGSFCLELLLTGGPGRYEMLYDPADLVGWLMDSRLAAKTELSTAELQIRPAELRTVKEFRDTLWTVAAAVAHGDRPARRDHELINRCADAPPRPRIDLASGVREWVAPITGSQVLGAAAREAIDLIGTARRERLRECAGHDCPLLFVDTSRPGTRRWCSMQRCGNRHKVHAYRARHLDA